jgi:hypothetical protein
MKALALLPLLMAGCSVDWSLARQALQAADASLAVLDARDASEGEASLGPSILIRCDQFIPLQDVPVIDGVLEPNLMLLRWVDQSLPNVPSDIRATVAVAYRPNGVYFFVDVEDPTRDPAPLGTLDYCGDAVELFLDNDGVIQAPPDYDNPGTIQLVVAGPVDAVTPSHRGQRFRHSTDLGAWTSSNFIAVPTARGYAVEAFAVASDLNLGAWTLAPGGKIGWNMSLNIGGPEDAGIDACTTRSQQIHLRLASSGDCTPPYCNASALCTPTLAVQ